MHKSAVFSMLSSHPFDNHTIWCTSRYAPPFEFLKGALFPQSSQIPLDPLLVYSTTY